MVRAPAKSSRFCRPAHCLLGGSLTRGFASRLDAPFLSRIDRVILAWALTLTLALVAMGPPSAALGKPPSKAKTAAASQKSARPKQPASAGGKSAGRGSASASSKGTASKASASKASTSKASTSKASTSKASTSKAKSGKTGAARDASADSKGETGPSDAKTIGKAKTKGKAEAKGKDEKSGAVKANRDVQDKPLSTKEKKAAAKKSEALKKECADKKAAKTKKCKAFAKEEAERTSAEAAAKLDEKCADKAARKSKECKAHRATRSKPEKDPCGRRYGRARKAETLSKFAKRYGVAEARLRELNDLGEKVKKLKAGRRLLIAKSPHDGVVLAGGLPMPDEPDCYRLRRPFNAFGKPLMVDTLRSAARQVQTYSPLQPKLMIGDLSKDGGGCLPPHKSHRGGLDADIGYYLRGAFTADRLSVATADSLDADRSWLFLRALLATGRVQYAFVHYSLQPALYDAALRAGETPHSLAKILQYPRPQADWLHTAIRHLDGHDDHLHLRMTCGTENCDLPAEAQQAIEALHIDTLGGGPHRQRLAVRERRTQAAASPVRPSLYR